MSTVHQRRVEREWQFLEQLVEANPDILRLGERRIGPAGGVFALTLRQTQALVEENGGLLVRDHHCVTLHLPRFFPSVPVEASLNPPVFHPNVNPVTGFVCLWSRFSSGDTVVEAIAQLQRVVTWQLVNEETDHLMQPAAMAWLKNPARSRVLPLGCKAVRKPDGFEAERTYAKRPEGFRQRLS
jgi:hypothetical protein